MTLYCGIDLHGNNNVISVIDETDRLVSEKRLDNELEAVTHHLSPYQDALTGIVVESTYNWWSGGARLPGAPGQHPGDPAI